MGGLLLMLPLSYITFLLGTLALCGVPFLTGFYSKDLIIQSLTSSTIFNTSLFIWWCLLFATVLTSFYSFRSLYYVFFAETNLFYQTTSFIKESTFSFLGILVILSFASCAVGYFLQPFFKDSSLFFVDSFRNSVSQFLLIEYTPA